MSTIETTKRRIEDHKRKSLGVRMARRVMGQYPTRNEREALRRHELGSYGRIREDALDAIEYSKKLNNTPRSVLGGGHETLVNDTEFKPNTLRGSLFVPVSDAAKPVTKDILLGSESQGTLSAVSFYTDTKEPHSLYVAAHSEDAVVGKVAITEDFVSALSDEEVRNLEKLATAAAATASWEYYQSRPENVG